MINKLSFMIYMVIFFVAISLIAPVMATADDETDIVLENLTPIPLNPVNNEMDVPVTPVNFTWKGVVGSLRYNIECYDSDYNLIFSADTISSATGHVYRGTLQYNTTYNWRVIPTDPPGDWSAVSWFTTEKQSSGAGNSTEEGEGSTIDSMKGPNAVMIIAIVIGVLAVILIIAYFALPKKKQFPGYGPGQQQGFGGVFKNITGHFQSPQQGYVPPPFRCPSCGAENRPGQQFCWDCGSKLPFLPPPPPPPRPQWNAPNQPPPGRPGGQLCPRCGDMVTQGERFCGTCGAGVAGMPAMGEQQTGYREQGPHISPTYGDPAVHSAPPSGYGAQPPPPPPPPPPNWQQQYGQQPAQGYPCPGCGVTIPYGEKACPACGTEIQW